MKVAIIGAGPAGLCALKHMLCHQEETFYPVAFERSARLGGQWAHTSDTSQRPLQSAVYDNMRCNIPKEMMGFPGFSFPENLPAYIHHSDFLKYLQSFANHYLLHPHIRLNTEVVQVEPLLNSSKFLDGTAWKVTTRNIVTDEFEEACYDAVLVCNGHYTVPHYNINGLSSFKGTVLHSQTYRNAKPFQAQNVLVVGSSLSGVDIAMEIASVANRVYLSQGRKKFVIKGSIAKNIVSVGSTSCVLEDGMVLLNDGTMLRVDTILLCTGYEYSFPFFSDDCRITVSNNRVQPLYKHIFNAHHPSMAFIGIHIKVLPLFNMDTQMKAVIAVFTGASRLPSTAAMLEDEETDYKERIVDAGLRPSDTHDIDSSQWSYYAMLAEIGGFEKYEPILEQIYHHIGSMRRSDVVKYKNYKCVILDWDECRFNFVYEF